ncbi:MAG: FAD-binding oxidoreductase [Candidatus Aminicenantes bacterium]|nr:FAD-binding oxidoreductase [Candidatus Aminicenantes bacterium]
MEICNSLKNQFIKNITGEVFFDELTRRIYSYSASICYLFPAAVIYPKDKIDVMQSIRIASHENIPLTARGAGSGVAGQNLGEGIILDFSKYMNRIVRFDSRKKTVCVEPGLIRSDLQKVILPQGLFFPPDPSSSDYATIGGMVANNSGGAHSLCYGTTKNYVKSLQLITSDAEEMVVSHQGHVQSKYKDQIDELMKEASFILQKNRPESFRSSCGYNLFEALGKNGEIDLIKIFCGSEGTLGIFTEIELELLELPRYRNAVLLLYQDDLSAFSDVKNFLDLQPSTIQALDHEFLKIISSEYPEIQKKFLKESSFIFLLEFDGEDLADLKERAGKLIQRASAFKYYLVDNSAEFAWFWEIRRSAAAYLGRLPGKKPTRWIEDAAVPVEKLPDFVLGLKELMKKYNTSAALFGHAGQGLLHFSPRLNRMVPDYSETIEKLGWEHALLSKKLKGVPSGEHGDGLLRTPHLKQFWGDVYPFFVKTKNIFDPDFRLNPLSVVPEREYRVKDFLKYYEGYKHVDSGSLNNFTDEIESCTGCGKCLSFCPVTRSVEGELGSTRARLNLLREVIAGHLKKPFDRSDLRELFYLCLHCKTCKRECPTGIDLPRMLEGYFEEKHLHESARFHEKILIKSRSIGRLAKKTNRFLKILFSLRVFERISGIFGFSNLKHLSFEPLNHKDKFVKKGNKNRPVVIFSGCTGDFFNSDEVKATIKLLEKLQFEARINSGYCCGESAFIRGFIDEGEVELKKSIESLNSDIDSETPILFTSASCLLPFLEYSKTVSEEVVIEKMQKNIFEATAFLKDQFLKTYPSTPAVKQADDFQLRDWISARYFKKVDLKVAVQIPCHLKILKQEKSLYEFIRLLPLRSIIKLNSNCCGFGGSKGFEKKWAIHAEKIGQSLLDEILDTDPDIIVSPCVTCRFQIRKLLKEKILFSEYKDLQNLLLSKNDPSNKILVIHPLILASAMLK